MFCVLRTVNLLLPTFVCVFHSESFDNFYGLILMESEYFLGILSIIKIVFSEVLP